MYDIQHDMNDNHLNKLIHNMLAETCLMLCFVFKSDATNLLVHEKSWAPVLGNGVTSRYWAWLSTMYSMNNNTSKS